MNIILILLIALIIIYVYRNIIEKRDNFNLIDYINNIDIHEDFASVDYEKQIDDIISENDNKFFNDVKKKFISKLENNNTRENPINKNNKFLLITFDNRTNANYIKLHNKNMTEYTNKWGHEYKYITECYYNVYWCKIHMVLDELMSNKYDYVMWLDSDTYIFNDNINVSDIVNNYNSDIFIGSDNHDKYDMTNAGVFIIKNSEKGINYLKDCLRKLPQICMKDDGKLRGVWAASCYEQGIMNILIMGKYYKNTTLLPNKYIYNKNKCDKDVFIMHMYASSDEVRTKCFSSKKKDDKMVPLLPTYAKS